MKEVSGKWKDTLDERLILGFRYLTGRRPDDHDLDILRGLTDENLAKFKADPEGAPGFLSYGDCLVPEPTDSPELPARAQSPPATSI